MQAVEKSTQFLRLSLIVTTLSKDGDAKRTDKTKLLKYFYSELSFKNKTIWERSSNSKRPPFLASKYLFQWKRIFLLPRLTGWQYCILKTNLSKDCCGRSSCTNFSFFYYIRFCESTEYRLKIEKQKYQHCGTGIFFHSTEGTGTGTKKVPRYCPPMLQIHRIEGNSYFLIVSHQHQ